MQQARAADSDVGEKEDVLGVMSEWYPGVSRGTLVPILPRYEGGLLIEYQGRLRTVLHFVGTTDLVRVH